MSDAKKLLVIELDSAKDDASTMADLIRDVGALLDDFALRNRIVKPMMHGPYGVLVVADDSKVIVSKRYDRRG